MSASPVIERSRTRSPGPPRLPGGWTDRAAGSGPSDPPGSSTRRRAAALAACLATAGFVFLALPVQPDFPADLLSAERPDQRQPATPVKVDSGPTGIERFASDLDATLARPWPERQTAEGRFKNMLGGGTRYGEAALGYALLQAGARADDKAQVKAGLKALAFAIEKSGKHSRASVFENFSVAAAYNVAKRSLRDEPQWRKVKPEFVSFLKTREFKELADATKYNNHYLADALAVLELQRSGLSSANPKSLVGPNRAAAAEAAANLINVKIPSIAAKRGIELGSRRVFLLSDPPDDPLAYQGLSLGMYARGIDLLGNRASPVARTTLRQAAEASYLLMAPDGDVAWAGRSQEQGWALAGTAYGATAAANLDEVSRRHAADLRGMAQRALERLGTVHGSGDRGFYITPSVRAAGSRGAKGVDDNAGQPSFTGLTLMLLNWTLPELRDEPATSKEIFSDESGGAVLSQGMGRFAVTREGPVWFSVKMTGSEYRSDDLRYDFGLSALKVRRNGVWRDVVPIRPKTGIPPSKLEPVTIEQGDRAGERMNATATKIEPDSAGPILRSGGKTGLPYGEKIEIARDGAIEVTGGWRTAGGQKLRSGVTFRYEALNEGVRMTVPRQAGDKIEYSGFFREVPSKTKRALVEGERQHVSFAPRAAIRGAEGGYHSAADPKLYRVRMKFRPGSAPVKIKITQP